MCQGRWALTPGARPPSMVWTRERLQTTQQYALAIRALTDMYMYK